MKYISERWYVLLFPVQAIDHSGTKFLATLLSYYSVLHSIYVLDNFRTYAILVTFLTNLGTCAMAAIKCKDGSKRDIYISFSVLYFAH